MARRLSIRRPVRRNRYAAAVVTFLLVSGGIVFAGAMGVASSAQDAKIEPPQKLVIPVTRIQWFPDRNDLCRTLLFHNDSGRYQDNGMGKCTIPSDMLTWTVSRAAMFAEAFKSAWKGDAPPASR
jgi:hypothetical protein